MTFQQLPGRTVVANSHYLLPIRRTVLARLLLAHGLRARDLVKLIKIAPRNVGKLARNPERLTIEQVNQIAVACNLSFLETLYKILRLPEAARRQAEDRWVEETEQSPHYHLVFHKKVL